MPPAPKTNYAASGDLRIAYQVIGDGPLDVVVVPPIISHIELQWESPRYRRWIERLARVARVIVFDKRGQGLSDRPAGLTTLEERIDDVRAVMDAARSAHAALIGVSEGGPTATLFAAMHPSRVDRLVLCGTFALGIGEPIDGGFMASRETTEQFGRMLEESWGSGAFCALMMDTSATADLDAFGRLERYASGPAAVRELWQMSMNIDIRAFLPATKVPTLVMRRSDEVAPRWTGEYLAAHIPDARYVEVPGTAHMPYAGDVDTYADAIEEFLTGFVAGEPADPDRVLASVLFADIAESTSRAATLGDRAWRDALDRFHGSVARTVDDHRGRVINTRGDDVFATFDGPARAVRAAQAIARVSRAEGFDIRAGVHVGEIELRGDDVAGLAVHIGARVASLAQPGEILVTSTVRDLVVGSGLEFDARGDHELRGVPGRWAVLAVR
jgi:pimeloyl-ACP methyl ester carboxylesterase